MLCHVTRPDSVVMEVEVDAKAHGEDCLNKVGCAGIQRTFSPGFLSQTPCHGLPVQQCPGCLLETEAFPFS